MAQLRSIFLLKMLVFNTGQSLLSWRCCRQSLSLSEADDKRHQRKQSMEPSEAGGESISQESFGGAVNRDSRVSVKKRKQSNRTMIHAICVIVVVVAIGIAAVVVLSMWLLGPEALVLVVEADHTFDKICYTATSVGFLRRTRVRFISIGGIGSYLCSSF